MCVKVSSGKAYVKGYDIDLGGSTIIDVEKPRDKQTVGSSLSSISNGNYIKGK